MPVRNRLVLCFLFCNFPPLFILKFNDLINRVVRFRKSDYQELVFGKNYESSGLQYSLRDYYHEIINNSYN